MIISTIIADVDRVMLESNMKSLLLITLTVISVIFITALPVQSREVPFTLADRDRIIRTEVKTDALEKKVDSLEKSVNQRFDDVNRRFDDVNKKFDDVNKKIDQQTTFMLWGYGILFSGMIFLMGFVMWDRRTALAPAVRKSKEVGDRAELLEKAFRELATKNPDVKEVLKHVGLL